MSNENEQRERVMAWAHMMRDEPRRFTQVHLPSYTDLAAVLLAQEAELEVARELLQRSDAEINLCVLLGSDAEGTIATQRKLLER